MKKIITLSIFALTLNSLTSCSDTTKKDTAVVEKNETKSVNLFDNPNDLVSSLSQNGIGELKEWSNPMEMGWGSLTDYFQFGQQKDGVGMQNNIAYYVEGTEDKVSKMYINLNINNPSDKQNALKFLDEITQKTFKTLSLTMPKELSEAIINGKEYQAEVEDYKVSNELEKTKIETWKVNIEKK